MKQQEVTIELYDKREKVSSNLSVIQLSEHTFRLVENDIFNCRLTRGTEFETRINKEGRHELIRIIKDSEYTTRRFLLSPKYKESEYRILGDELVKRGGFWQVDFGGIVTVNIPKNFEFDQLMKDLDINLEEIINEQ
ncbi:MAG: DUF4265 domain-containing protein [Sporocytophaga sp.]|nr:DUF4265 domain-containing protein [Sporocytophaga sp.]